MSINSRKECHLARLLFQSIRGYLTVLLVDLDANGASTQTNRFKKCRPTACERIKDHLVFLGEVEDNHRHQSVGFLGRMDACLAFYGGIIIERRSTATIPLH